MDASTVLLPSQLSVYVWAPITLITFGCAAWLMVLLRDEPEAVAAVTMLPEADEASRRRRTHYAMRTVRKAQRKHQRKQRLLPRERYLRTLSMA